LRPTFNNNGKLVRIKGMVIVVFGIRVVIEEAELEILDLRVRVKEN
jgi:hypothetical protein